MSVSPPFAIRAKSAVAVVPALPVPDGGVERDRCTPDAEIVLSRALWDPSAMLLFITPAYAQSTGSDPLTSLLVPLALMLPIFYFLVIRPKQTQDKQRNELLNNIRRGDTVVMASGLIGRVTKAKDGDIELEVEFSDTMRLKVSRRYVVEVRAKGEPVKEAT